MFFLSSANQNEDLNIKKYYIRKHDWQNDKKMGLTYWQFKFIETKIPYKELKDARWLWFMEAYTARGVHEGSQILPYNIYISCIKQNSWYCNCEK